jgi:aminoglycoside 2'-N-acetyltransferase I
MTPPKVLVSSSAETAQPLLADLRDLLVDAFEGEFSDEDWEHCLGGWHVVAFDGDTALAHAAVVPRSIRVGNQNFAAGYVEGVATRPDRQRQGLGSQVMTEAAGVIRREFDLGVLSTDRWEFYQRAGWERWQGPTFVRTDGRLVRTEDEDDGIMVLRAGPSQEVDVTAPISCDSRPGDDW